LGISIRKWGVRDKSSKKSDESQDEVNSSGPVGSITAMVACANPRQGKSEKEPKVLRSAQDLPMSIHPKN
jgi:hypothetical protein